MTERQVPEHNHLTRDIRPEGNCPGCDRYWQARGGMVVDERPCCGVDDDGTEYFCDEDSSPVVDQGGPS